MVEEKPLQDANKASAESECPTRSPAELPPAALAQHRPLRGRAMERLGEIVIVFVGVYAAFLLNRQLTPMFAWYLTAKQEANTFAHDYLTASEALLAQVRTERAGLR
jgi:hypothetical protein